MYLDGVLASQDLYGGFQPRVGEQHLRVIGITSFPLESAPEMLSFLNRLPVDFRWSNRFIFLDPAQAERALKVYRRNWFQKRHGLVGLLKESFNFGTTTFANRDAVAMAEDADEAVAEASANTVRFGYYTSTLLLFDRDRAVLEATSREVLKQLQHHGFGARIEEANALEAWLGSLPGQGYQNVRRPLLHTLNLAVVGRNLPPGGSIGERIVPLRKRKGISQRALASIIETTQPTLITLEKHSRGRLQTLDRRQYGCHHRGVFRLRADTVHRGSRVPIGNEREVRHTGGLCFRR